mgnify:FL=1
MLKIQYALTAGAALLLAAGTAQADHHFYAKAGVNSSLSPSITTSATSSQTNAKSGIMPELTFGYKLGDGYAVEFSYQQAGGELANENNGTTTTQYEDGDLVFESYMLRGIYHLDVKPSAMLNPYFGFGLGQTKTKLVDAMGEGASNSVDSSGTSTSSQITLGNRFDFNKGWFGDIAANYTHVNAVELTRASGSGANIDASNFTTASFTIGKSF